MIKKGLVGLGLLGLAVVVTETISQTSFALTRQVWPLLPYTLWDPYGVYLYITVHHVLQLVFSVIAILAMVAIFNRTLGLSFAHFGLRFPVRPKQAWILIAGFAGVWSLIQFGVGYLLVSSGSIVATYPYPLSFQTLIGQYAFQLLLSGTSEELLYRALIVGMAMVLLVRQSDRSQWTKSQRAVLYAFGLIPFLVGHIPYQLNPFQVGSPNLLQLITVFIFGSFYTHLFIRYKSVILPMVAHGVLNAIIITSGFMLSTM
jgi:membrane protease YdiL (CAAX protease family)